MNRCEKHKTNYSISCSKCEGENDIFDFGSDFLTSHIEVAPGQINIFELEEEES